VTTFPVGTRAVDQHMVSDAIPSIVDAGKKQEPRRAAPTTPNNASCVCEEASNADIASMAYAMKGNPE